MAENKTINVDEKITEVIPPPQNRPTCLIVLGMAGSGKTSFVNQLSIFENKTRNPYIINLDPACRDTPYPSRIGKFTLKHPTIFIIFLHRVTSTSVASNSTSILKRN